MAPATAPSPRRSDAETGYESFPNLPSRNLLQTRVEIPMMVKALRLPAAVRVLEVGCGPGVALPVLHRMLRPLRLVGLDLDAELLERARSRMEETATPAGLHLGDVRALPFADESFDLVVDFGTCFHIARAPVAIREVERVLAVGGLFASETRGAQLLSHPIRTRGRRMPWRVSGLRPERHAVLWRTFRRVTSGPALTG